jgi:hypothetical protein
MYFERKVLLVDLYDRFVLTEKYYIRSRKKRKRTKLSLLA